MNGIRKTDFSFKILRLQDLQGVLTRRQLDVAGYIWDGHSDKEIAEAMGISIRTVSHYVTDTKKRLGVQGRSDVARIFEGAHRLQAVAKLLSRYPLSPAEQAEILKTLSTV